MAPAPSAMLGDKKIQEIHVAAVSAGGEQGFSRMVATSMKCFSPEHNFAILQTS